MTKQEMREFAESQVKWYSEQIDWNRRRIQRINADLAKKREADREMVAWALEKYPNEEFTQRTYTKNYKSEETKALLRERAKLYRENKLYGARVEQYKQDVIKYTETKEKEEETTMKSINISNLTLDLYVEYIKPAALDAGIMELVENDGYTRELVDAAAAVAIERCMTEACFDANCTENDTVFDQAEEMLKALGRAIEANRYGAGETLAKLREALEKALNASKDDEDEGFERFEAAEESMYKAMVQGIIRRQGGFREKDIIAWPHYIRRGTWNEEHKVVEIISKERDAYGYRNGCAVDIITRRIVG